jgi:hypothetical protein
MTLELSGTLAENLQAAVRSAERLRQSAVHKDTLGFWEALLAHARVQQRAASSPEPHQIAVLIGELQAELAMRP